MFKDALYRLPAIARQLSGAHRISGDVNEIRWQVQALHGAEANLAELASRLEQTIALRPPDTRLTEACMAYDDFPFGKTTDYERKFVCWLPLG